MLYLQLWTNNYLIHLCFNFLIRLLKISFTFENQHWNLQRYKVFRKDFELNTEVIILKH